MFKTIQPEVWAFDAEWAPDPKGGRLLYNLPEDMPDQEVMQHMWNANGATPENPQPYLKTIMCRILSISAVVRIRQPDGRVRLQLRSRPDDPAHAGTEKGVLGPFLQGLGERRPQLVGFNSINADIKAFIQRAVVNGLQAKQFCQRPDKPWLGVDYFAKGSDAHVDLRDVLGAWGITGMSLNEAAVLSGIPGKMDVDGQQVPLMWAAGRLPEIVAYNEFDALTTYLLWLRVAHFAGFFTAQDYEEEQRQVEVQIIEKELPKKPHLGRYLEEWQRLRRAVS